MDIVPLFSFLAGIASVISPCILPVIPLLMGYMLLDRKKTEILSFVLGFFSIFTIVIFLTIIFTAAINYYLHYFRIMAAIAIMGLGVLILLNKNLFNFSIAIDSNKKGIFGSFIWGLLTSVAWAPCYGYYLIALIAYSVSSGNTAYSAINIILYTLGFSLSIFSLGMVISKVNIEKLIKRAELTRKLSGILIIVAGIYMLWLAVI